MATTIWLDEHSRDRLAALKRHYKVTSIGAVIRQLLDQPQETARQIYERRKGPVDAVCKRFCIRRLVAFGSRARGDARPGSDLDLLVEMEPGPWLADFQDARDALEQAFACPTDIILRRRVGSRIEQGILRDGVVLYEG